MTTAKNRKVGDKKIMPFKVGGLRNVNIKDVVVYLIFQWKILFKRNLGTIQYFTRSVKESFRRIKQQKLPLKGQYYW